MASSSTDDASSTASDLNATDVLTHLDSLLHERKKADSDTSYVASLFAAGRDKILKKVGEEATETVIAAKNADPEHLVYETADLWFHTLIMLADQGLGSKDVIQELARRMGTSGHEEKNSRKTRNSP